MIKKVTWFTVFRQLATVENVIVDGSYHRRRGLRINAVNKNMLNYYYFILNFLVLINYNKIVF
jgi:hypothetical protein